MRSGSFYPRSWNNRDWKSGDVKFDMIFGESAEAKFGAPYLLAHRGDLHAALASAVPDECVRLSHKLTGLDETADGVRLTFANGATAVADAVVGADGVHSIVRDILFGQSPVNFTGRIAYRTTYPASLLNGERIDDCTKWWGEDRHIVIYYVKPDRSEVYFVTSQPEPEFRIESWSAKGDVRDLRKAYAGFHPQVEKVLAACPDVHKWAIVDRNSLERWADGKVTLLGDACHPMTPYMAQGAAMAIEDAAVLSRCLEGIERDQSRRCLPPLRDDAARAHLARAGHLAQEHLAQGEDRYRLGLWLRRLDRATRRLRRCRGKPLHTFPDHALNKVHAAVEHDGLAGHVVVAEHHQHRLRDLLGMAEPAERDARGEIAAAAHHVGVDQRRRDRIDGDAVLDQPRRVAARQALHAGLGGVVVRADRAGAARRARGDVDDAAPFLRAHRRYHGLRAEKGRFEIDR